MDAGIGIVSGTRDHGANGGGSREVAERRADSEVITPCDGVSRLVNGLTRACCCPARIIRPSLEWYSSGVRTLAFVVLVVLSGAASFASADGDQTQGLEHEAKAAFLYQFGGYVEWPQSAFAHPDSPLIIGIHNADAVASALDRMRRDRVIGERPLEVRHLRRGEPLTEIHILFAGGMGTQGLEELLASVQGLPVLTVTELQASTPPGSVINFVVENNRVRFDASLDVAKRHRLRLSSRLLSVARIVRGEDP